MPATFEQLRTTSAGNKLRILVDHLVAKVTNPIIINALLTLKWHFSSLEADDRGLNETRAYACEIVAWRFLGRLTLHDAMRYCLYELEAPSTDQNNAGVRANNTNSTEQSPLLPQFRPESRGQNSLRARPMSKRMPLIRSVSHDIFRSDIDIDIEEADPTTSFTGLNGLEIAAVADCKKFLSQRIVQKIITGIWTGDITFWESLSEHTKKRAQFYNSHSSDPFTRLRVPRYIKAFEVVFFGTFIFLYYAVLIERNPFRITPLEIALYVWFAAFAYDELGEFIDAGSIFYAIDIWNSCDLIIILIGLAFLITRVMGLVKDDGNIVDISFDILSLEALFMVPRICSLLSLHPYFGTLIPCLKQMAKDFVKFMVVVAVLYIGFLTTFSLLARDTLTLSEMSWILVKVFFGASTLGFESMNKISLILGPPLMLAFICMTNILLITSMISILSNSFARVISRAREEYLLVYSVYVLEASTSNRLTHFYPPLVKQKHPLPSNITDVVVQNLIPLIFIRPLRLFISSERIRVSRIFLLKVTHLPIVVTIYLFERLQEQWTGHRRSEFSPLGPYAEGSSNNKVGSRRSRPFLLDRSSNPRVMSQYLGDISGESASARRHVTDVWSTEDHLPSPASGRKVVGTSEHVDLEAKIDDLSAKIAELTALVMAQQGTSVEEA
ncbi:hypothetical protein F5884DRAFT_858365 [Xylogone sp. PMI_703]|nr:hypothetical protein F5884DRAFT_858365 [Xylogone sp. PMI_703]